MRPNFIKRAHDWLVERRLLSHNRVDDLASELSLAYVEGVKEGGGMNASLSEAKCAELKTALRDAQNALMREAESRKETQQHFADLVNLLESTRADLAEAERQRDVNAEQLARVRGSGTRLKTLESLPATLGYEARKR